MRTIASRAFSLALLSTADEPTPPFPSDDRIREVLKQHYHSPRAGVVVGLMDGADRRIITSARGAAAKFDGDTVFEIGSVTKTFTGVLLADMVLRGEVRLNDSLTMYLPDNVRVPKWHGREISLLDLATHTSGLPRLPSNLHVLSLRNPYRNYTEERLYRFLESYRLRRDAGAAYEYSNVGAGLLGHILSLRAGLPFEDLVHARITEPAAMHSTGITMSWGMEQRRAHGHGWFGNGVPDWKMPGLPGAGALRSTVHDMMRFMDAAFDAAHPLAAAMSLATQARVGSGVMRVGLCWHTLHRDDNEIVWHNGSTGGYTSFVAFNRASRRGVVLLSNSARSPGRIGLHLMNPRVPLTSRLQPSSAAPSNDGV